MFEIFLTNKAEKGWNQSIGLELVIIYLQSVF